MKGNNWFLLCFIDFNCTEKENCFAFFLLFFFLTNLLINGENIFPSKLCFAHCRLSRLTSDWLKMYLWLLVRPDKHLKHNNCLWTSPASNRLQIYTSIFVQLLLVKYVTSITHWYQYYYWLRFFGFFFFCCCWFFK